MTISPEQLEKELRKLASSLYFAKQTWIGDKVDALANRVHEASPECGLNGRNCVICSDRYFNAHPLKTQHMTPEEQREYVHDRKQD